MANWSNPLITTQYDVFLAEAKERDVDAATMFVDAPTNPPTGAIKLLRSTIKLQEWDGLGWVDKVLSVEGGGTGGANAADARTALGIGTMGTQNANAVAITGGVISGLTSLTVSGPITPSVDNSYDIGTFAAQFRRGYFKSAFVLPVGVDKYATS